MKHRVVMVVVSEEVATKTS